MDTADQPWPTIITLTAGVFFRSGGAWLGRSQNGLPSCREGSH